MSKWSLVGVMILVFGGTVSGAKAGDSISECKAYIDSAGTGQPTLRIDVSFSTENLSKRKLLKRLSSFNRFATIYPSGYPSFSEDAPEVMTVAFGLRMMGPEDAPGGFWALLSSELEKLTEMKGVVEWRCGPGPKPAVSGGN